MRIVHVRPTYFPLMGGTELDIDQIGRYLVKKGHEFVVLTSSMGHYNAPYDIVRLTLKLEHTDCLLEKRKALRYYEWLLKEPFDVIHLHTFSVRFHLFNLVFYPIFYIGHLKNVPIVFTLHGSKQVYWRIWKKMSEEMKKSDYVVFVDYFMLKYAKDLNISHFDYVPAPTDTSLFYPRPKNVKLLKSLDLHSNIVILSVSRLEKDRNVVEILKAAKNLKSHSHIVFIIVGGGSKENYLKHLAKKWDCNNVIFVGQVPNNIIPEFMSVSDVFINPIDFPGIGRNVLEAMACGKPVLRKVVEKDDPLLQDEKNFVRYENENLADKILMLANDKELRSKIGRNATKFVDIRASVNVVGDRTEKVYEQLFHAK